MKETEREAYHSSVKKSGRLRSYEEDEEPDSDFDPLEEEKVEETPEDEENNSFVELDSQIHGRCPDLR